MDTDTNKEIVKSRLSARQKVQRLAYMNGLTLTGLAEKLGVSLPHLWLVLDGQRESAKLKIRVAKYFNLGMEDLWQ